MIGSASGRHLRVVSLTSWLRITRHTTLRRRNCRWRRPRPVFLGHETAFAALYTELVQSGELPLSRLIEVLACAPGRWVGGGTYGIFAGAPADLTLVDLSEEWTVQTDFLVSRSSNSPYLGRKLKGRVKGAVVGGELVYDAIGARFGAA
jgi:dihydroorotase